MNAPQIRRARSDDAGPLSALALRSTAHWGYDQEFLDLCRPALTYTPPECGGHMFVAEVSGQPLGFAHLEGAPPTGMLSDLFVDPSAIGHGVGRLLLAHICDEARAAGFRHLELDADPHAKGFYAHHGAVYLGEVPSDAVPGRTLPRMRLDL